ncbi:MAG: hypothetical protein M3P34_10350 [Actinomycetota bacterium]|nr:hypothetical protein [Actinomycetota bacterium]
MGADASLRTYLATLPVPTFDDPAFVTAPPLAEATVAMVTTAALHHPDQGGFGPGDRSFRQLDQARRDLVLGHLSRELRPPGLAADLKVVYPVDRLDELAADGVIGAVSPVHLAFLGAQDETMSTIRLDRGPAAAAVPRDHGVDVAILPSDRCARAPCVRSHTSWRRTGSPPSR